ncbi:MAG TPA: hypothetical protein VIL09_01360 [Microvirga sp.]
MTQVLPKDVPCTKQDEFVLERGAHMRDRRAKFVELATKRVNKTIAQMRLVGNLSNRATYEYTDDDARKIVRALQREVDAIKARFGDSAGGSEPEFKL